MRWSASLELKSTCDVNQADQQWLQSLENQMGLGFDHVILDI